MAFFTILFVDLSPNYQAEKRANPAKIHYFFSASKELSGKFMITYMPRDKVLPYFWMMN